MGDEINGNGVSREDKMGDGDHVTEVKDGGKAVAAVTDTVTTQGDVTMEDVAASESQSGDQSGDQVKSGDKSRDLNTIGESRDQKPETSKTDDDSLEPPSKRQKVDDETEKGEPGESRDQDSKNAESSKSGDSKSGDPIESSKTDSGASAVSGESSKSAESSKSGDSTESPSAKKKKDGKISTFFAATNGGEKDVKEAKDAKDAKGSGASGSSKSASGSTGNASTPSKKTKTSSSSSSSSSSSKTPTSSTSSTPLKLRLKTKPTLPALQEDHDEENPNPDQLPFDSDSIENHPDIAFCVMFRTRFTDLFDGWCPPLSPQEFEAGIQPEDGFSLAVESYLVRVMSLMMNRKKPVEVGKYSNALETWSTMPLAQGSVSAIDAMSLPCGWSRKLASRDVVAMDWRGRLQLLKMATVAALSLSDAIKKLIADKREVSGRKVLSELQWLPLGEDRARNTYWLADGSGDINFGEDGHILPPTEGAFDTQWRLYRQTNPYKSVVSWQPVASSPEELATLIEEMPKESGEKQPYTPLLEAQHKKLLSKLEELIPRALGSRERIREAEERAVAQQAKKAAAARAHEYQKSKIGANRGRTRGKRVDYKQLAAPQDSEDEFELKEEDAVAQGHRRTGRTRTAAAVDYEEEGDDFEVTPSPEPEGEKPETPRNADGKRVRYVEKQGGGRRGKGWVYVVEEELEQ